MIQTEKKVYAIGLLKNHLSYEEIQNRLKCQYNSGMSNRDLAKLRKEIDKTILSKNLDTYQEGFMTFYESMLSLKELIKNPDIMDEINKYHDLFYETQKDLAIKNLPKELRTIKVIQSITESIDEIKNGDYTFFDPDK